MDLLSQLLPWSRFSFLSNVKVLLKVLLTSDSISTSCADVSAFSLIWQLSSGFISILKKKTPKNRNCIKWYELWRKYFVEGVFFVVVVALNLLADGLSTFPPTPQHQIAHCHVKAFWFGFAPAISPSSLRFIHQDPTRSRYEHRSSSDCASAHLNYANWHREQSLADRPAGQVAIPGHHFTPPSATLGSEGATLGSEEGGADANGCWLLKEQTAAVNGGALNGVWLQGTFSVVQ